MARTKLTAYLVKQKYNKVEYAELIKEDKYDSYQIRSDLNIEGQIIVGHEQESTPDWLTFLRIGTNDNIPNMSNKSTRAVIFIKHKGNLLLFTHGQGRHMIKESVYKKDFGLKIVLNSIEPNNFRSIDAATIDVASIQTRSQSSRTTQIRDLNFDAITDLLRSVTGTPKNDRFGKVISGRDTFHFTYEFNNGFRDFNEICQFLIDSYESEEYKEHYSWVDNLQRVEDRELKEKLNELLIKQINNKNVEEISLGIPEIIDYTINISYSYTEKGENYEDINIKDYYNRVERFDTVSLKQVKNHYIFSQDGENEGYIDKWKVYDCLIFETSYNNTSYILTIGEWFKVDDDYAKQVESYIEDIEDYEIKFPRCKFEESEEEFNGRASNDNELPEMINMDRKNLLYDNSKIELCDLLTNKRELIHVKKWYSSSTLSHLFSQGRISGELLLREATFRQKAINKISEVNEEYAQIISLDDYLPTEMTIVFAIIDKDERALHKRLPFFSKLNMMQATDFLRGIGYEVKKAKIVQEVE